MSESEPGQSASTVDKLTAKTRPKGSDKFPCYFYGHEWYAPNWCNKMSPKYSPGWYGPLNGRLQNTLGNLIRILSIPENSDERGAEATTPGQSEWWYSWGVVWMEHRRNERPQCFVTTKPPTRLAGPGRKIRFQYVVAKHDSDSASYANFYQNSLCH